MISLTYISSRTLELRDEDLKKLNAKIEKDPRHQNAMVMSRFEISSRKCTDWMAGQAVNLREFSNLIHQHHQGVPLLSTVNYN